MRGGAAAAAALVFPGVARAADPSEEDLALLRLAASAELVAISYYMVAGHSKTFTPAVRRLLLRARETDLRHYRLLAAQIGADAPRSADLDVSFPRAAFGRPTRALGLGLVVERTLRGIYLHAAAVQTVPELRAQAARFAASEAAHASVLERLSGGSGLGGAEPEAVDPERASAALRPYWGGS